MSIRQRLVHGALISPDYARLWAGQAVSVLGDMVFLTTLVLWVGTVLAEGQPWAPAAVSGIVVATGAAILVGPIAGTLVDRWDSRRTALGADVVRGVLAGLLTAVVTFVPVDALPVAVWLGLIYLIVFGLYLNSQFFQPARFTLIRDIVSGEVDRARAAGIAQATGQTVMIVGPPLAAPLMFGAGVQWALLFNALSYGVSFVAIRSVRARAPEPAPEPRGEAASGVRAEFVAGLKFFRGNRTLVTLLSIAVIGQLGIAPLTTLNVFFLTDNLHASTQLFGYLGMALGVGGVLGALCTGRMVRLLGARTVTWAGIVLLGVLLIAYSRQTAFGAGLVLLFLLAIPMTMANTAVAPLLLGAAPREYVGRTTAVFNPVNQLTGMLGTLVAGWLLSSLLRGFSVSLLGLRLGPVDLILMVAGGLIVLSGLYARVALRQAAAAETAAQVEKPVPDTAS